jgi:hypothetical protein
MTLGVERKDGEGEIPAPLRDRSAVSVAKGQPDKNCRSACKFLAKRLRIDCRERSWSEATLLKQKEL